MRTRRPVFVIIVAVAAALACAAAFTFRVSADDTDVHIVNFVYSPAVLTVPAGTAVRFINDDTDPHTVSSLRGAFESGVMEKGDTWTYTFDTAGTYDYYCIPHPFMLARVIVQ